MRPVNFETESATGQEMLAIVFTTQKFREYILRKTTVVQTGHKPLETIRRKPMAVAPLRLQAMILKLTYLLTYLIECL